MTRATSQRARRTYFNNPLFEESLRFLPDAIQHPTSIAFRTHLAEVLPQSSEKTRQRFAAYISQRFSHDGRMNLDLALSLARFRDSRTGREILYYEMLQAIPLLAEIASLWLAEQPSEGAARDSLLAFLERRLGGRSADRVGAAAIATFRQSRKITSARPGIYVPVWVEPPLEAFLYVLARLYPERAMIRVDHLTAEPVVRALLWPRPAIRPLLEDARRAGHVSRISELDQYHQFTLSGSGSERMVRLLLPLGETPPDASMVRERKKSPKRRAKRKAPPKGEQLSLFPRDE